MDENKCERENDIVQDAYFLISLFNKDNKEVTQLQVQKIMYFFEAYYMCITDKEKLYDCNFNAWAFGPVSIPLYQALKKFGDTNIVLNEKQLEFSEKIIDDKKQILKYIYCFWRYTSNGISSVNSQERFTLVFKMEGK